MRGQRCRTTSAGPAAPASGWSWRVGLLAVLVALSACATGATPAPTATTDGGRPAATAERPASTAAAAPAGPPPVGTPAPPAATMAPVASAPPRPAATRLAPSPRGDQSLTLAGGVEAPRTLDPALIRDSSSSFLARQVFAGLIKLDDRLEPVPDLAVAMPSVSPDRLTYRFHLRDGLRFHDGTALTAEMVRQSFERATDPRLANGDGLALPAATYLIDIKGVAAKLRGQQATIDGIRVTGPTSLEIDLAAPQATFLVRLTHTTAAVVDVRQAGDQRWWQRPNGLGPFRLSEWREGDRLVLTRAPAYHDGPVTLERVTWLLGANASQPLNLYEAGKIDWTGVGVDSLDRLMAPSNPLNQELRTTPQLALTYLAFNVREPPFDDARVRRAFARVVDRARIARVMFDGKVEPAHGLVPPRLPGGDLPAIAHDAAAAAAARQLLADSRHAGQVPRVRLFDPGGGMGSMLREVFQRDLGVTVDVISAPWNDYLLGLERREYPAYILSWSADYPDAQSFVESMFKSDSAENHSSYANPRVDSLLEQASRETDPAARAALYRQVQAIILDDAVAVPLYFGISYLLVKPHVKGLAVTPMGIVGLERAWVER